MQIYQFQCQNGLKKLNEIFQNYKKLDEMNLKSLNNQNRHIMFLRPHALILISLIYWVSSLRPHNCIHDHLIHKHNIKLTPVDDKHLGRNLQSSGFGPIRIHYIYNTTDVTNSTALGQNIYKIMDIIKSYWEKIIQVDYQPFLSFNVDPVQDRNSFACLQFKVSRDILDNPIPNKDFGVLVEAKDDGDSGVTAYSYPCAYSTSQNKPTWGIVHWNTQYMTTFDPLSFQENIHIAIHEMTHVFGFSQLLYPFFRTGSMKVMDKGTYLTGPYINAEVEKQYGCPNPPGMLLQGRGGSGTALSHWSRKTAMNQLMTAGVSPNNPTISYITLALLQQTGWYRKIYKTYGSFVNFGYRKGCSMLETANCSSNQYCKDPDVKHCDYDRTAVGFCKNDSLSDCLYIKYYVNYLCIDPNYETSTVNAAIIQATGEKGGKNSRCFNSDLRTSGAAPSKHPFRCYEVICSSTMKTLTIRIGNTFGFCMFPGQTITIRGYDGTLTCPLNFQEVCAVKRCPKECSANGICLQGKCLCGSSFSGQSCSELSTQGFGSKINLFLPENNNNCLIGSYLTIFGDCEICPFPKCAKCNSNQCLICMNESLPRNGKCA